MLRITSFFIALVLGSTACLAADATTVGPNPKVTVLDDSASQLREDFNNAQGKVRLLFVVDPICPTCLLGISSIDAALLSKTNDPRLQIFIVHVPVIGAKAESVPHAFQLLHNPNVHHYWNQSGNFGRQVSAALQLKRDGKSAYAWDVWMIYPTDAVWDVAPPAPSVFMHQLPGLSKSQFLDADVFGAKARALLAAVPFEPK
jgi:hypothetical protein